MKNIKNFVLYSILLLVFFGFIIWTGNDLIYAIIKGDPCIEEIKNDEGIQKIFSNKADGMGIVFLTGGDYKCTGTLITNDVVLTARHCVLTSNPGLRRINALLEQTGKDGKLNKQYRTVKHLIRKPGQGWTNDLALLALDMPFEINGQTEGFKREIYKGANKDLVGQVLTCYGYGFDDYTTGVGILRRARMKVESVDEKTNILYLMPNEKGQVLTSGDSGCSCFVNSPGWPLATVHHKSDKTRTPERVVTSVNRDYESGPDTFRDWLSGQISSENSELNFFARIYFNGGRTIKGVTFINRQDFIKFYIKSESLIGLNYIKWSIFSIRDDTGSLQLVEEQYMDLKDSVSLELSTGIRNPREGIYEIQVSSRDGLFSQQAPGHEAVNKLRIKVLPDKLTLPVSSIIVNNDSDGNNINIRPGEKVKIRISAESDIGLFQVGYGLQKMDEKGAFGGSVAAGTKANVRYPGGKKDVTYIWDITLDEAGSYRIYSYSRDILYGSGPGHQSPSVYRFITVADEEQPESSDLPAD